VPQRDLAAAAHDQIEADRDDREYEEFGYDEQPVHLTLADQLKQEREQAAKDDERYRDRRVS
jgi:hypothetical protein